jgi:hypothetical protein
MAFHELLKPGQSRHLRNWKVPFVYLECFPAGKSAANNQDAAGSKTHGFAETHTQFSIAGMSKHQ